jgi:hypothetical protein
MCSLRLRVRRNGFERLRIRACPRLAPGSGFGSVGEQTTLANGVEPRQTAAGSRPSGPKSLTRGPSWRPQSPVPASFSPPPCGEGPGEGVAGAGLPHDNAAGPAAPGNIGRAAGGGGGTRVHAALKPEAMRPILE